jgi:hypothetical protein
MNESEAPGVAWCMIPGLERFESKLFPMNIVSSSAILMYYLMFAAQIRDASQNVSIGLAFPLLFLLQIFTFYYGGCQPFYYGELSSKFGALLIGSIVGIAGWGVVKNSFPMHAPFGKIGKESFLTGDGWSNKKSTTSESSKSEIGSEQCPASEDGTIPVIGELYKNGSPVEDISK